MAYPVILLVKNEALDLPAALWTLARSEVAIIPVVVNNGSTDNSKDIAAAMGAQVIDEPNGSKMAATQAGIQYAREMLGADTALFSDGDTVFPRYWAGSLAEALHSTDNDNGAAVYGGSLYWLELRISSERCCHLKRSANGSVTVSHQKQKELIMAFVLTPMVPS